jgi:type I restriction enzyme, S subunit
MSWDTILLGEVMNVKHGYAFKSQGFSDSGDLVLLTPGNCHETGGLKLKGDKERYYVGEFPPEFLLVEGDMLVVMTDLINAAPILGGSFVIPEDNRFLHNQRLGLVQITDESRVDRTFLYYLLNTYAYRAQVRGSASGATVRHTSPGRIRGCNVRLPRDVGYQRRVGSVLSAYDDLIENNRRRIALLEETARQLYREWFVRFRFPGHEHTPTPDGVPEGWERASAFSAMEVLSGGTPKTTVPDYWDGEIPFYTPKDAADSCYVLETERAITELGLKNCNSRLFGSDTVFISARGTVGKLNLASRPMAMSQSCYALIGRGHVSQFFLFCALREAIEHFKQHAVGAVFDAIVVDTFKLIPFVVPDEKRVRHFDEAVAPMFREVANLMEQNFALRAARDLLLPRLMSGEMAA